MGPPDEAAERFNGRWAAPMRPQNAQVRLAVNAHSIDKVDIYRHDQTEQVLIYMAIFLLILASSVIGLCCITGKMRRGMETRVSLKRNLSQYRDTRDFWRARSNDGTQDEEVHFVGGSQDGQGQPSDKSANTIETSSEREARHQADLHIF